MKEARRWSGTARSLDVAEIEGRVRSAIRASWVTLLISEDAVAVAAGVLSASSLWSER
jgi:hypothetical protein